MAIEIQLIQEIEKRPCLYNYYMPEYNRKEDLEGAWLDVSKLCNLPVSECKDKWKNIRSSFVRSLKQKGSGRSKKQYYLSAYLQFVQPFLKGAFDNHDSDSNITQHDDEMPISIKIEPDINMDADTDLSLHNIDHEDFQAEETSEAESTTRNLNAQPRAFLTKKKRIVKDNGSYVIRTFRLKRQDNIPVSTSKAENNAMKYFMMSLLPEFDTMNEEQIRLFKIKVMVLINEIKNKPSMKIEHSSNERIQKRLINLLLQNLEKGNETANQ